MIFEKRSSQILYNNIFSPFFWEVVKVLTLTDILYFCNFNVGVGVGQDGNEVDRGHDKGHLLV
jgi:hypothetical protein